MVGIRVHVEHNMTPYSELTPCMPTSTVDALCVDTNVLAYAYAAEAPWHAEAVQTLADDDAAGTSLRRRA